MIDEQTIQTVGIIMMIICALLVYIMIDITLYGPVYRLYNDILDAWNMPYDKPIIIQNKEDNMYQGFTGYASPCYINVWVSNFIDSRDPDIGKVYTKVTRFTGTTSTHDWRWLSTKCAYGWVERDPPKPPPEPSIYISDGAQEEVARILSEYAASRNPIPAVEIDEQQTKSINLIELP